MYTLLELTQYLRQIRPERFFQHAEIFRIAGARRAVSCGDRTHGRGDASLKPAPLGPQLGVVSGRRGAFGACLLFPWAISLIYAFTTLRSST